MADNSAFISYRREVGYSWARLVWDGLRERDIDAFLDLESMRAAGRFDQRLLNQVAARPYFVTVLTAQTLERCESPGDWMRRELEHAIERERIIVPVFVAPFAPSQFPSTLPTEIAQSLSQSNGLTLYSQYLSAGLDKLANELLAPVGLGSAPLSPADARFQRQAERTVRAVPSPEIESTPEPEVDVDVPTPDDPPEELVIVTPETGTDDETRIGDELRIGEEVTEDAAMFEGLADLAAPEVAGVGHGGRSAAAEPAERPVDSGIEAQQDDDRRRRGMVAVAAVALVLVGIVGLLATQLGSGEESSETTVASGSTASDPAVTVTTDQTPAENADVVGPPTRLPAGQWLMPGEQITSDDGTHVLQISPEGRLELRVDGRPVWTPTRTGDGYPTPGSALILQDTDANLVLYPDADGNSDALWASGRKAPDGDPDAMLRIEVEDGVGSLVMFGADGELWRSNSSDTGGEASPDDATHNDTTPTTTTSTTTTSSSTTTTSTTTTSTTPTPTTTTNITSTLPPGQG